MAFEDLLHPLLSLYIRSPQWVKSLVGGAYSAIPLSLRRGRNYKRFLREVGRHTPDAVEQMQAVKLRATLRHAFQTVPAYRKFQHLLDVEANPFEILSSLPLLSKEEIKRTPDSFVSTALPVRARLETFTGGSTSTPLKFFLQKAVTRPREYAYMDDFHARVGLNEGDRVLALRGRSVPTAREAAGKLWMVEPIKNQLILSCDHLQPENMPQYIAAIKDWQPRFIQAYPSALYPLAKWLRDHAEPEIIRNVEGILLYSENVFDYQMSLFKEVFGCPVLKHYGHSERVLMAASLPEDSRYYFWPQYGFVELVDEHGKRVTQPGQLGEIVGTSFDNEVMPFIRYRTGDMAVLGDIQTSLLPGYFVVERIEGRQQEFLVCKDKRLVSICTMGAAHFEELADVDLLQYEQREPGHFALKIVSKQPLSKQARKSIVDAVIDKTQGGCTAEIVEVNDIPRTAAGKHRMLIQHLDMHSYFGANDRAQQQES